MVEVEWIRTYSAPRGTGVTAQPDSPTSAYLQCDILYLALLGSKVKSFFPSNALLVDKYAQ